MSEVQVRGEEEGTSARHRVHIDRKKYFSKWSPRSSSVRASQCVSQLRPQQQNATDWVA